LVAWGWWSGIAALRETRSELHRLLERRTALENANRELQRQLAGVRHDREARARAAREVLQVAGPDEVVVVLPSPTPGVMQ
jgi:cell division protein FtsB